MEFCEYQTISLIIAMIAFVSEMAQHRRDDAGNTGATFYQVTLQPGNWYKWFGSGSDEDSKKDPEDPSVKDADEDPNTGWTVV